MKIDIYEYVTNTNPYTFECPLCDETIVKDEYTSQYEWQKECILHLVQFHDGTYLGDTCVFIMD